MPSDLVARPVTWADPAAVFAAGPGTGADAFWLDAGPDAKTGWSWLGSGLPTTDPADVRRTPLTHVTPGAGESVPWGPFRGGWIGVIGYDAAAARAGAPHAPEQPAELWLRVDAFVAVDHRQRRLWAVASADLIETFTEEVARWVDVARSTPPRPASTVTRTARARVSGTRYAELVEACRDAIREGDAYQLCLTTRFEVAASPSFDTLEIYERLRHATPAHHGGLLRTGGWTLLSASPERFLDVTAGIVRTRPIKGTRPRGVDAMTDAALATELRESPKERAENVMIVDLMRNDLSRICEPSSVSVESLLVVESYPAVHQLVSSVSGRLRTGTTLSSLLAATFPAGSMTGAPKLSAMGILHALEREPRGLFAGCFGWVGDDGSLDLAMVIRSVVLQRDGAYVGAGGGITWHSDAAAEVAEVALKARAPLAALGATLPADW